jgi:hypothetical protein
VDLVDAGTHYGEHNSASPQASYALLDSQDALDAIAEFRGPVVVDLDETLYLANSTEDFIALARPYVAAAYVLRLVDLLRPWRWTGGPSGRDNWHVLAICVLFPWTFWRWKQFCRLEAPKRINQPLLDALLSHSGPVIIATNGYRRLLGPLLRGTQATGFPLISCGLRAFSHRSCGKAALVEKSYGRDFIGTAAMVTDSLDDRHILGLSRLPILTRWAGISKNRKPRDFAYLPGDYLNRIKQPNQRVWRILLREDVLPWVLVCLSLGGVSAASITGSVLLFASLWAVYEAGYFDNDKCAIKYEFDPKIKPEFTWFTNQRLEVLCWMWAVLLGACALFLIHPEHWTEKLAIWTATLLACRATYYIYNRIDKDSRIFLYPLLQTFRFGALITVLDISYAGACIVISQIVPRWHEYAIYRYVRSEFGKSSWPKTFTRMFRFETLVLLLVGGTMTLGLDVLWTPAVFAVPLFLYPVIRFESKDILRRFSRIDHQV